MARRAAAAGALPGSQTPRILRMLRTAAEVTFVVAIAIAGLVALFQAEEFVISDERFLLRGEKLSIKGTRHASAERIREVFASDLGRSLYLCPIQERRRRLLAIPWVKEAAIQRVWPDSITAFIVERTPVAFAELSSAGRSMTYQLIDADGVLLQPQEAVRLTLPVVTGVKRDEPEAARRQRVQQFLQLQTALAEQMDEVSAADVSDPDNLKVLYVDGGETITLMLGRGQFRERWDRFESNLEELRKRVPGLQIADLRLKDRVSAFGRPAPKAEKKK